MRIAPEVVLTAEEERALIKLSRSNTSSVRLARRARIVLLASHGKDNRQIAAEMLLLQEGGEAAMEPGIETKVLVFVGDFFGCFV